MSGAVLKYSLVVRHPETDAPTALLVGQSVPSWATDLVHKDDLETAKSGTEDAGDSASGKPTKADLKAEIDKRNEGRAEGDLIVPTSEKNADLEAALAADDAKNTPPA